MARLAPAGCARDKSKVQPNKVIFAACSRELPSRTVAIASSRRACAAFFTRCATRRTSLAPSPPSKLTTSSAGEPAAPCDGGSSGQNDLQRRGPKVRFGQRSAKSNIVLIHIEPYCLVRRNRGYANVIEVGLLLTCEIAISGIRGKS
jgi:hypothetical protein